MVALFNAGIVLLGLYLIGFHEVGIVLYLLPLFLLSLLALLRDFGRVVALILVVFNVCLLCVGMVVFFVVSINGVDAQYGLSQAGALGVISTLLVAAFLNVLKLRGKAGINR
jgi:hypothetical protein